MRDGLRTSVGEDHVATVEFDRPPHNHFDVDLIGALADAYEQLDSDPACRVIVLCSNGRHFCAGANFAGAGEAGGEALYEQAVRMFAAATPVVAAVQGAAIGGGLGLALSADFRVASASSRFAANFARLGTQRRGEARARCRGTRDHRAAALCDAPLHAARGCLRAGRRRPPRPGVPRLCGPARVGSARGLRRGRRRRERPAPTTSRSAQSRNKTSARQRGGPHGDARASSQAVEPRLTVTMFSLTLVA